MCLNPFQMFQPNGEAVQIRCQRCWQCKQDRIDDWVGRNIAESKTAVKANAVTLTYGRDRNSEVDHIHARVLVYSDFQKFMKRLRFDGYPARYFVAGEYGEAKGRAHWHALIYWQGKPAPGITLRQKKIMFEQWPHGYAYWDELDVASVRYAAKYVTKGGEDEFKQAEYHMSRMPPLGSQYFIELARKYVKQRIAPQDLYYSFPEVLRDGKRVRFRLSRRCEEMFLSEYVACWKLAYPGRHMPPSELVEAFEDKQARGWRDANWVYHPKPRPARLDGEEEHDLRVAPKAGSYEARRLAERLSWARMMALTPEEVSEQADRNWEKYHGKKR